MNRTPRNAHVIKVDMRGRPNAAIARWLEPNTVYDVFKGEDGVVQLRPRREGGVPAVVSAQPRPPFRGRA